MSKSEEIGRLVSVSYNGDTDDVSVVFKITDSQYKDFVLRWAKQEEGRLVIRGEQLLYNNDSGGMRSAGRLEIPHADV